MIKDLQINDLDRFVYLGNLIKKGFEKTYILVDILKDINSELKGYYINEVLVGFIHIIKSVDSIDVINIVVDNDCRRKGIASKLIEYILLENDNKYDYFLEVRESNEAAINLYKKYNFEIVNIRKKYYGNENALLMKRGVHE